MASQYAFVSLLTSDSYLPGALTLAAALRDIHPSPAVAPENDFQTVCLVTPEIVDVATIKLLRKAFDVVVGVEVVTQKDDKNLQLLGRPDLNTVLTKLHVFRLTQYTKIIFLDADVLPVRPLSHLFSLPHEFSAVPDVGWPDIFNSGVLVLNPGQEKFDELNELLDSKGSWDGGDQGILNEWRGNDWNRLSFTYNTTPTAAYTYAPAYERYGSKISAIHFIGPNKPWYSVPYRTPFRNVTATTLESFTATTTSEVKQAYDYDSLVDRWFAVYDKHYRAEPLVAQNFQVQRYASAWDHGTPPNTSTPLGLEELRKLAMEGVGSSSFSYRLHAGDGEYRSLPLGGRLDLIRRQVTGEAAQETGHQTGWHPAASADLTPTQKHYTSHSTHNVPSSTVLHSEPLPQTPSFHSAGNPHPNHHQHQHHRDDTRHAHHQTHRNDHHHSHQEPSRPASPPKMLWNPASEPPPNTAPPLSVFPSDTYFPNAWDQHSIKPTELAHDHTKPNPSESLFIPPPPPEIPASLRAQGHYRRVTGEDHNEGTSSAPDPGKVKSVFPWESMPRHLPSRKFPNNEVLDASKFVSNEPSMEVLAASPPPLFKSPSFLTVSPNSVPPATLTFKNAWDTVPSIQKYAQRLVEPAPLAPTIDTSEWKKRESAWNDRAEVSSMDGDDEDEGDDDHDDSDRESRSKNSVKARSRRDSESISASYLIKGKKKEYRVRGVQTDSREMRSHGVQVSTNSSVISQFKPQSQDQGVHSRSSSMSRGTVPNGAVTPTAPLTPTTRSNPGLITPTGARSPREFFATDPNGPGPTPRPVNGISKPLSPIAVTPRPRVSMVSPPSSRQVSHDGSSLASPPSSVGPLSPPDSLPLSLPRKGGRVWDPARGVDLFKRGSEEVLARFLRMGSNSWEEDSPQA